MKYRLMKYNMDLEPGSFKAFFATAAALSKCMGCNTLLRCNVCSSWLPSLAEMIDTITHTRKESNDSWLLHGVVGIHMYVCVRVCVCAFFIILKQY